MDPFSMIIAVTIAAAAWYSGYVFGRRQRTEPETPRSVCEGCDHNLSFHDEHGVCQEKLPRKRYLAGLMVGHEYVQCPCRQYLGHIPADRLLSTYTRDLPAPYSAGPGAGG